MCFEDMVMRSFVALIYVVHVFKIGVDLILQSDTETYNLVATPEICSTSSSEMMSHTLTCRRPLEF